MMKATVERLPMGIERQIQANLRVRFAFTKMSTIFVGKWDRFATDFVVADKFGRIVG